MESEGMSQVAFELPEEILFHLGADDQQARAELRLAAAIKLFELGRLSAGAAAELAGIPKPLFLEKLSQYGTPTFDLTDDELARDLTNA
jgi:predicted HTH domain antitoxin